MSAQDQGNQQITYKYSNPVDSENFNKYMNRIIKDGVYDGGLLSMDGTTLRIAPFIIFCRTSSGQGVRIETTANVESDLSSGTPLIPVTEANPLVVCNFPWLNNPTNYLDWSAKNSGTLVDNDIVFGAALFSGGSVVGFEYGLKTWGLFDQEGNVYVKKNLIVSEEFQHSGIMAIQKEVSSMTLEATKNYFSVTPLIITDGQEITLEDTVEWKLI